MLKRPTYSVIKVTKPEERIQALEVLADTYQNEKNWVTKPEDAFPESDLHRTDIAWFMSMYNGKPAGTLRVWFDLPIEAASQYDYEMLDDGLNVEEFIKNNKIAEIGKFAIKRKYRRRITCVMMLIKAAAYETVKREYTHFVTEVFEGEATSPFKFHMNVIGFQPVATHEKGELNCDHRRITMILDIRESLRQLKAKRKKFFRQVTDSWDKVILKRYIMQGS